MALLSACADKCPVYEKALPPTVLLAEVPEPHFRGKSNGDLLAWAIEIRKSLRLANSDKRALKAWAAGDMAK